jgi:hypothetical protein
MKFYSCVNQTDVSQLYDYLFLLESRSTAMSIAEAIRLVNKQEAAKLP